MSNLEERLNRQMLIEGWDQNSLDNAKLGIVGDNKTTPAIFSMSSSALGINNQLIISPSLDDRMIEVAKKVNPNLSLSHINGVYTHNVMNDIFKNCNVIVDLTNYSLSNKLLLNYSFEKNVPIIRCSSENTGFKIFSYCNGREWSELEQVISKRALPKDYSSDVVLDIIASGIILEETKNILMGQKISDEIIEYKRKNSESIKKNEKILVVGAGALGNFTGLGLAYSGFENVDFIDPDITETTNLNRQVFLYNGVGKSKAKTLSKNLNQFFGINSKPRIEYFTEKTDTSDYDIIFDCVDNFETRIVLSEKCKEEKKMLISGGTNVNAGQVVIYNPLNPDKTPAELLGLYDIVSKRKVKSYRRERSSCTYRPDPSVIMTNQIIAGFMVDSYKRILDNQEVPNIFYDSSSDKKF